MVKTGATGVRTGATIESRRAEEEIKSTIRDKDIMIKIRINRYNVRSFPRGTRLLKR